MHTPILLSRFGRLSSILGSLSLCLGLTLSSLALSSLTPAYADNKDQELIKALKQATYNQEKGRTDLDLLTWLASMSEKIERRVPDPHYRIELLKAIGEEALRANLDPQLVLAVIDIESNFNRHAMSHAGAQGLMQVMPFWKNVYGDDKDDLYQYRISLRYGCAILRHYLDKYKNTADALAAYNGSLGKKTYSDKVLKRLNSSWQFKVDKYSRRYQISSNPPKTDLNSIHALSLN